MYDGMIENDEMTLSQYKDLDTQADYGVANAADVPEEITDVDEIKGRRERLRSRIQSGAMCRMAPCDVMEFLLYYCIPRKDTRPLARKLLKRFGSLSGVFQASAEELAEFEGVSRNTAVLLSAMSDVAKFYIFDRWNNRAVFPDSITIGQYLCDLYSLEDNEAFYIMSLDSSLRLIKVDKIYSGTVNQTVVFPRLVAELAIKNEASAIVLSHNHPGGNLSATEEDISLTKTLIGLMTTLSVKVIDHMIICSNKYSSMKYRGQMVGNIVYDALECINNDINGDWDLD